MPSAASFNPPEVQQYVVAFKAIENFTDKYIQILQFHYDAPEKTITAKQLSQSMGYSHHSVANRIYGGLANLIGKQLDYNPEPEKLGTLVTFEKRQGEWHWILRPQVVQALEILEWIVDQNPNSFNESLYQKVFSKLVYDKDIRHPPDNRRRGQFISGWKNATLNQRHYVNQTLSVLTWNNLGYRFGKELGDWSESEIKKVYEFVSRKYVITDYVNSIKEFSDEVDLPEKFREGTIHQIHVNAYERDSKARQKCIDYYGSSCSVCNFNFGEVFGEMGEGFIHVHHLRPISEIGEEYEIDPVIDLRPVCPNCHAMIHRHSPPLKIEEIKALLEYPHCYLKQ